MRRRKFSFLLLLTIALLSGCASSPGQLEARAAGITGDQSTSGRVIHVSVADGSDTNAGTSSHPIRSIQRGIALARPGDTVLIAPGVYRFRGSTQYGLNLSKSGRSGAPITLRGSGPGVILDCSAKTSWRTLYCLNVNGDHWRLVNFSVRGANQNSEGAWAVGIHFENASNNLLEGVDSYDHQGPGILLTGDSRNNLLRNCKSHSNYDPRSETPGGNADGVGVTSIPGRATGNVISNCSSYNNSDDGFDLWQAEAPVTIKGSTASRNGWIPGTRQVAGDGVGFKLGRNTTGPLHQIIGNRAIGNRASGFDNNGAARRAHLSGNKASGNGGGSYRELYP